MAKGYIEENIFGKFFYCMNCRKKGFHYPLRLKKTTKPKKYANGNPVYTCSTCKVDVEVTAKE